MYCARHPDTEASRRCERCGALHCDICIRPVRSGAVQLECCAHCDGLLKPAGTPVAPPLEELRELFGRVFSVDGLLTAFALAIPAWMGALPMVGRIFRVIYLAALAAYYFKIVDHIGRGRCRKR